MNTLFVIRRLLATAIDGLLVIAFTLVLLAVSALIAAHTVPAIAVPEPVCLGGCAGRVPGFARFHSEKSIPL